MWCYFVGAVREYICLLVLPVKEIKQFDGEALTKSQ